MKKITILCQLLFLAFLAQAQLTVSAGAQWVNSGNVTVTLNNMNFVNDGSFTAGTGSVKFSGNQNSTIAGLTLPSFHILELSKTNNSKLLLDRNISVGSFISFITGQLDLNNNNIILTPSAYVAGESENNRIIGANGGFVEITQDMNSPLAVNAGNLGATITSDENLGSVIIRRGHIPQNGTGLPAGINRYYTITPANNSNLNATLRLRYFDAELNSQNENILVLYKSNNNGADWNNMSQTSRNTNANYVEKTNMSNLTLQTLADDAAVAVDGVTGFSFTGQRKKATEVTLKWTSQTETNMSGYQVQRRLKHETFFSDRAFVNSLAPGGNSFAQLNYQHVDENSYTDISYYRLKIMTTNNTFTYSNEIAVAAKTKGGGGGNNNNKTAEDTITTTYAKSTLQSNSSFKKVTVGPNPNNGNFWFSVNGIDKETIATLFTVDGKQINQFRVVDQQQQKVNSLKSGIYFLKIPGCETQKIIVNGGGNQAPAILQTKDNLKF